MSEVQQHIFELKTIVMTIIIGIFFFSFMIYRKCIDERKEEKRRSREYHRQITMYRDREERDRIERETEEELEKLMETQRRERIRKRIQQQIKIQTQEEKEEKEEKEEQVEQEENVEEVDSDYEISGEEDDKKLHQANKKVKKKIRLIVKIKW